MAMSSRRAENVAIVSLVVDVVFFVLVLLIGRWSGFVAVNAAAWLILSAALVWAVLALQFHQRSLAEQEKLDLSQLGKAEEGQSRIFQASGEQAGLFAVVPPPATTREMVSAAFLSRYSRLPDSRRSLPAESCLRRS